MLFVFHYSFFSGKFVSFFFFFPQTFGISHMQPNAKVLPDNVTQHHIKNADFTGLGHFT